MPTTAEVLEAFLRHEPNREHNKERMSPGVRKPRPEIEYLRFPICAPFARQPARLLDLLLSRLRLSTDSSLAYTLGIPPPLISKIRNPRQPLDPALLLRILEITDSGSKMLNRLLRGE